MRRAVLTLLAGSLAIAAPGAGERDVSIEVQPRDITVGDPVEMVLSVAVEPGERAVLPPPEAFKPAEIYRVDTLSSSGGRLTVRYTLSLFEPGRKELPDLPVVIAREDGTDSLWVDPGEFEVRSVLDPADSSADIRDIHPPVKLAWTFRDLLPYILALVLLVAVVLAGYLLWKHRRRKAGMEPRWTPPPLPPEVTALRRLEELRVKQLWQNGFLKEYYSELTDILKEYIGGRFALNAPEMTTTELLDSRSRWQVDDLQYRYVRRALTCADLVKFARFKADPQENERNLKGAFEFIERTKPVPEAAVATEGGE